MKGVRSKRMIIQDVSPNLKSYMNLVSEINFANVELRSGGIIISINKGLKPFTWIIPYYQLVIYKTNGISIHAQGRYIHFKSKNIIKEYKAFFNKLLDEKVRSELKYDFLYQ